ncbi:glycosyltransferase [Chlorogloeopsis fritschii PCC 9212]|uniref:Glycosyl transferase n=1 Tax=Chlorogloeopsis fritschii PCC 6912 TaxID=211165 RepID=A0A433NF70_CHLFR|nr:glycosyltransferase [Chlorogloeopsis fritschii]RUR80824.1 glycosyl transferase [Chlorogloeopsis fritschii PCC 6912]
MPLISIILPVYNGEKTLLESINSVLSQSLTDFELIIINDGSQDSTLKIIKNIKDPRLRFFSYPNAGQAVSRNRGLSHAVGEYIAFIDADDIWTYDKLEAQLKQLQAHKQAKLAYSWTNYIDEQSKFLFTGMHLSNSGDVYDKLLVNNFLENGSNPLVCRQAIAEVGGFDPSVTPAEDWDLWLRIAARYQFVVVPSPQILYRVSATSESANILRMEAACLQVINRNFAEANESVKFLESQSIANLYKYLICKVLQEPINQKKGLLGLIFVWRFFIHDSYRVQHFKFTLTILFKILVFIIFPGSWAKALIILIKKAK